MLIHYGLTASASAFAQKSTGREELVVVGHADWSVQAAQEWAEIGRAAFLNKDVELMRFCDNFLKDKDYFSNDFL